MSDEFLRKIREKIAELELLASKELDRHGVSEHYYKLRGGKDALEYAIEAYEESI